MKTINHPDNLINNDMRNLEGGGNYQLADFKKALDGRYFENGLELCCGKGYIGFGLLENRTVSKMDFCDINHLAIDFVKSEIANNGLKDKCETYLSDGLDGVSKKYDLIVCNPPWFNNPVIHNNNTRRSRLWKRS